MELDNKKKIVMGIFFLLFVFLIWLIFFYNKQNKVVLLNIPTYIHTNYIKEIPSMNLAPSEIGYKFTYSFWIYFKNMPENGNWKSSFDEFYFILYRFGSPNVLYYPKGNVLRIFMSYKDEESDISKDYIDVTDLNLQKWHNVVITLDNKNLDIYINGDIYSSLKLKNVPFIYNRPLLIGHKNSNFNGHIAKLEYYNDILDHNQIKSLYENTKDDLPKDMLTYSEEYYINKSQL